MPHVTYLDKVVGFESDKVVINNRRLLGKLKISVFYLMISESNSLLNDKSGGARISVKCHWPARNETHRSPFVFIGDTRLMRLYPIERNQCSSGCTYVSTYVPLKSRRGRKTNNENVINYVGVTLMRIPWCQIAYRKLQFGIARSTYPARRRQSLLLAHKLIVHKAPSPSIDLLSLKSTLGQEHPTGLPRDASTISVQYSTQWLGGFTRQPADWLQIKGNRLKLTN